VEIVATAAGGDDAGEQWGDAVGSLKSKWNGNGSLPPY